MWQEWQEACQQIASNLQASNQEQWKLFSQSPKSPNTHEKPTFRQKNTGGRRKVLKKRVTGIASTCYKHVNENQRRNAKIVLPSQFVALRSKLWHVPNSLAALESQGLGQGSEQKGSGDGQANWDVQAH